MSLFQQTILKKQIALNSDAAKALTFEEFKEKILSLKKEFTYEYRSEQFLRDLAHIYFRTPYFPDKWRYLLNKI